MTTGVVSNYLENKIIDHTLRNTGYTSPSTSIYVALFTDATAQDDANSGTEVSGGAYARQQVTSWAAPSSGSTSNSSDINFPTASGDWGNIRYIGIMDASTAGNLLFWGQLSSDKAVGNGDTFSISTGDLDLWLGGAFSHTLSGSVINHTLRNTAFSTPGTGIYAALYTDDPTPADSGTEVSGGSYARKQITQWSSPTAGSTVNIATETFDAATAAWGTISHVGIRTASTGGDLLYSGSLVSTKTVGSGDTFRFSASALTVTIA